jgi:hypothetical protein
VDPTLARQIEAKLIEAISAELPSSESLLESCSDHWGYEDPVYRFYQGYGNDSRQNGPLVVGLAPPRPCRLACGHVAQLFARCSPPCDRLEPR